MITILVKIIVLNSVRIRFGLILMKWNNVLQKVNVKMIKTKLLLIKTLVNAWKILILII